MAVGTPCTHAQHFRHAHDMDSNCGCAQAPLRRNKLSEWAMLPALCFRRKLGNLALSSSLGLGTAMAMLCLNSGGRQRQQDAPGPQVLSRTGPGLVHAH